MLEDLRAAALAKYGARVDAVINAKTETIGREVYARGVAVHFVDQWPAKAADPARSSTERSVTDRLRELDQLGASGAIRCDEEALQVLADDLVQNGARRVAGRVPQGRDGCMTLVAGGALACHETRAWQWPAATASLE